MFVVGSIKDISQEAAGYFTASLANLCAIAAGCGPVNDLGGLIFDFETIFDLLDYSSTEAAILDFSGIGSFRKVKRTVA